MMSLDSFTLIPTPLPPMLADMVSVTVDSRYFSIGYFGSKARWSDGRSGATFSYYGVYEPLIHHMAIACFLWDAHLGSDDEYPTHLLLCDRRDYKLYIGEIKAVDLFLDEQHPPLQQMTKEQWEILEKAVEQQRPLTENDLKQLGMFEMFGRISHKQQQLKFLLVQWLDQQINKELIERYLTEARAGNYNAIWALQLLEQRVDAASAEN